MDELKERLDSFHPFLIENLLMTAHSKGKMVTETSDGARLYELTECYVVRPANWQRFSDSFRLLYRNKLYLD